MLAADPGRLPSAVLGRPCWGARLVRRGPPVESPALPCRHGRLTPRPPSPAAMETVLWSVWGRDWSRFVTADEIVRRVRRTLRPGGTILHHETRPLRRHRFLDSHRLTTPPSPAAALGGKGRRALVRARESAAPPQHTGPTGASPTDPGRFTSQPARWGLSGLPGHSHAGLIIGSAWWGHGPP